MSVHVSCEKKKKKNPKLQNCKYKHLLYQNIKKATNKHLHADEMCRTSVEAKGKGLSPVKRFQAPSNILLTVPIRYYCCGSSILSVVFLCVYGL